MNLPNKLSLARIILVPFILLFMLPIHIGSFAPEGWNNFVCENGMIVAAILFVIASLTDLADGKIARKYNLITNLGKFLDSLADKMLVISVLIAFALRNLSAMVLGWLPGFLGQIPFLQVGLPAVLSLYFDIFSGCMQAFIFAMITMMNSATAVPEEE